MDKLHTITIPAGIIIGTENGTVKLSESITVDATRARDGRFLFELPGSNVRADCGAGLCTGWQSKPESFTGWQHRNGLVTFI